MSDDFFTHDEASFEPGESQGGVTIEDGEARYADLVADVIWAGTITPESRQRLETARDVFGLAPERAAQIEEAQIASQRVRILEEPTQDDDADDAAAEGSSMSAEEQVAAPHVAAPHVAAPDSDPPGSSVSVIATSDDPRIRALQRRIIVVEDENDEIAFENRSLRELVGQLENLVEQLQFALEETLDELHQAKGAEESGDYANAPTASMVHAVAPSPHEPPADEPEPETQPRPHIPGAARRAAELHGVETNDSSPSQDVLVADDASLSDEPTFDRGESVEEAAPAEASMARRRFRSHEEIEEAIEPVFAGAWPGVTRRRRRNPADLHAALAVSPRDPQTLRALLDSLGRADDADRRWCVAQALAFVDEADEGARALYEEHADSGLVRPRRGLDDREWQDLLFHPDEERLTGQILAAIAPAVLLGQMTAIRASIPPELLHPEQQIDPQTSTLQSVRCLVWAAAILGLPMPPTFVVPNHEGCIDVVLNPRPSTRLGQRALAGRRSRELAFEAGRHLSWYRREHLLGRPSRSVRRLEDMFLAALMIGNPGLPISPDVKKRVEPIARTIRPLLDQRAIAELEQGFSRFVEEGGRTKLGRWLRGAERTAHRAGMLLANDLWAAESMLKMDDPDHAEGAIDDLIVFVTSETYGTLRRRLGIALASDEV